MLIPVGWILRTCSRHARLIAEMIVSGLSLLTRSPTTTKLSASSRTQRSVKLAALSYSFLPLLEKECMRACRWLSRVLRQVGNKRRDYKGRCRMSDDAYGSPMDYGCWFMWTQIQEVANEAIPQAVLPSKRTLSLTDACAF